MVEDQRDIVQVTKPLNVIKKRSLWKSGFPCDIGIGCQLGKLQYFCKGFLFVPKGGFVEGFDSAHGKCCLLDRLKDIPHTFAVHGLYIAIRSEFGKGAADGVAGTVVFLYEHMFRWEQSLI